MPISDESLPPPGPTLRQAFELLVAVLNERGIAYAIIGGLATIQHTRVRTTDDIDLLINVPQLAMPGLFEALRDRGFQVDLANNIRELRDQGLTIVRFADVIVDLLRPVLPAYGHVLDRAVQAEIFGQKVRISSVEGLIVMKLIAMRPQDEMDIQDLLAANAGLIDLDFVRTELASVCGSDDPRWKKLEDWLRRSARDV